MKKNLFTLAVLFSLLAVPSTHGQKQLEDVYEHCLRVLNPNARKSPAVTVEGRSCKPMASQDKNLPVERRNVSLVISTHWTNGRSPQEFFNDEVSARQMSREFVPDMPGDYDR